MTVKDTLKNVPFFVHFSDHQWDELINTGSFSTVSGETVLFEQGDPADSLYVILKGSVKVFGQDHDGNTVELSTLSTGNFFGELALVDGGTRSATIETVENCEFFVLSRQAFINLLSKSPQLISDVLAGISSKIRSSNEKFFKEMLDKQRLQSEMEIERHRSLSEMVAGVAHEINTPLGIVNVTASMITENLTESLLSKITDDDVKMTLEDIMEASILMQNNIARANKLIQTFKSISVSQISDTLESTQIHQLIQEIMDLFKIKARQANLSLNLVCEDESRIGMWTGYAGFLSQILMNLLTNVERYAYNTGEGGQVDLLLSQSQINGQPAYQVQVKDYGKGIPEEDVPRVFDVFFTTGRNKGGTGLGMSIVHNLVTTAMQGQITLDSKAGEGTTVTILLPQKISPTESSEV